MRRLAAAAAAFALLAPAVAAAETHRFRGLTVEVDAASAFPGGIVAVRLVSRRPIRGTVYGILDGRRCPAFPAPGGLRALVPIPVTHRTGQVTLGVEIRSARGRQRFAIPVAVAARAYPPRDAVLSDDKRALAGAADSVRDGRRLQLLLRTVSDRQEWRAFRPPVDVAVAAGFGAPGPYAGLPGLEAKADAIHGEYHRGLDYEVAPGTAVRAPAAGAVLFAGDLALTGRTVVIDHGQGLLSVLAHLGDTAVREGERIEAEQAVGASGSSGIAAVPHVHWAVYLHGVAIDPRVTEKL